MLDTLPGWRRGLKAGTFFLLHIRMENGAKYKNLAVLNRNQNTRSRASGSNYVYALLMSWLNMVSLFFNSDGPPLPPKLATILEWEEQKGFRKDCSTCYSVFGHNGETCFKNEYKMLTEGSTADCLY